MTNFEHIVSMAVDEMAGWIDKNLNVRFEETVWTQWYAATYCKKCEPVKGKYKDSDKEINVSYCEINGHCRFFREACSTPDTADIVRIWLEQEYTTED